MIPLRKIFLHLLSYIFIPGYSQTYKFNFSNGYDGWSADFADYPKPDSVFYELEWTRERLPAPLNTDEYGLKVKGNNHSDDLFMFIKRKISELLPHTDYLIKIEVKFASKAPTNAVGIGGPPGEAVVMKTGASLIEPGKIPSTDYYLMNIDKGNQSMGGKDMEVIGHIGVSDTTTVFTLISRNNFTKPFRITTDSKGEVWICIGTDSGFEGKTTLYYNEISIDFMEESTGMEKPSEKYLELFPNPCSESIQLSAESLRDNIHYNIIDQMGRLVQEGIVLSVNPVIYIESLPSGLYFMETEGKDRMRERFIKR